MQNVVVWPLVHLEEFQSCSIPLQDRQFPHGRLPELFRVHYSLGLRNQLETVAADGCDFVLFWWPFLLADCVPVSFDFTSLLLPLTDLIFIEQTGFHRTIQSNLHSFTWISWSSRVSPS